MDRINFGECKFSEVNLAYSGSPAENTEKLEVSRLMFIPTKSREELIEFLSYNLLTPYEAAVLLETTPQNMCNLKSRGTIQPAKITDKGQVLYLRSDILKYINRRQKRSEDVPLLCYPSPVDYRPELASIQALAAQGLLSVFPARIGTTVYCIDIIDGQIVPGTIEMYTGIDADGNGNMEIRLNDSVPDIVSITCSWYEIGRTVFLTEEQAQLQLIRAMALSPNSDGQEERNE